MVLNVLAIGMIVWWGINNSKVFIETVFTRWNRFSNAEKIVLIGDSRVSMGNWSKELEGYSVVNCGIGGVTTLGVLNELEGLVYIHHPTTCIIQVGINDIRNNQNSDSIFKNYEGIINNLLIHQIDPVVTSVIFLRKDFTQDDPNETYVNNKADSINFKLKQLCDKMKLTYLDFNKYISEDKRLKVEYTSDGIHLNEKGYSFVYTEIEDYLNSKKNVSN